MDEEVEVVTTTYAGHLSFEDEAEERWAMYDRDQGGYHLSNVLGLHPIDVAIRYVATGLVDP